MADRVLRLAVAGPPLAVCRLAPGGAVPEWALDGPWRSVTVTPDEVSVVCPEDAVPDGVRAQRGLRCLAVAGPLDFSLTGVLAGLAAPLADAGVPVFALSTFDTDLLLVPGDRLGAAIEALQAAGHAVLPRDG